LTIARIGRTLCGTKSPHEISNSAASPTPETILLINPASQSKMNQSMFQDGWVPLVRIVVIGTLSYIAVVALLRYFGKRALTKMNAFDMVVTVAVGSSFSSAVMTKNISLADGVAAFILLLVLQRLFATLSIHLGWFGRYLKAQPLLVVYRGKILWDAAKKEQLGELEILGGIRNTGTAAVEDILAMVLEPTAHSASSRWMRKRMEGSRQLCVTLPAFPNSNTTATKIPIAKK
jgi:hypothetical protein